MSADDITALWAEEQVTSLLPADADVPVYGSLAWLQLPATDPRRAAAIITAAEQWRRHQAEEARLDRLADTDPEQWWQEVTADADAQAQRILRRLQLSRQPTAAEMVARRQHRPVHQLRATPGWPPITIPGSGGRLLVHQEAA